jgi:hypothetical protein
MFLRTLPLSNYDPSQGRFSLPASPAAYDTWLQGYLDHSDNPLWNQYFISRLKLADEVSKLANKPFVNIIQTHLWYSCCLNKKKLWCDNSAPGDLYDLIREPTNEELKMMANIAVTYGAKAQFYFVWTSGGAFTGDFFYRGLSGTDAQPENNLPRDNNVYNQYNGGAGSSKFGTIAEINSFLNAWGAYLMSFDNDNRHSYIYRLENERNTLLANSYFRSIAAGKQGYPPANCNEWANPSEPIPPAETGLIYDCKQYTYLQAATFKQSSADPGYPFFMIVNKRCSPEKSGYPDGKRKIKVLFDVNHPEINAYDNWKIRDLGRPGEPVGTTFVRSAGQWVNLDWFKPGEGKLYKLEPVFPNGGTLQGDEIIPSGNYTILDTIFTNGYDLTIEAGASLHFTDSSTIVVSGGKFTAGTPYGMGASFGAVTGNAFHGLYFSDGAEVKIYNSTFSGLANDTSYAVNIVNCPVGGRQ